MSKKHSVNVSFEEEDYKALRDLADDQDRTINGQARHLLRAALADPATRGGVIRAADVWFNCCDASCFGVHGPDCQGIRAEDVAQEPPPG